MGAVSGTTAIVVGLVNYGESDRIVKLLTPNAGLVSCMVRGVRKSKKRYGGAFDLGNVVEAVIKQGRGRLPIIGSVDLIHGHPHLRGDLVRLTLMSYLVEVAGSLAQEGHEATKLFGVLQMALLLLDGVTHPPGVLFRWSFEAKALTFAGIAPELRRCSVCGAGLDGTLVYGNSSGGATHSGCGRGERLSIEWCRQVEAARRTPLAESIDVKPVGGNRWTLHDHLAWHGSRPMRSRVMLANIEEANP